MKMLFSTAAALLLTVVGFAQNGLENIVVETYYVSNAADQTGSSNNGGGNLPLGSVTYRIYADLLPGYTVQAMYGVAGHALVFNTSTSFFNNEDRGSHKPNWTRTQANEVSVNLDSYLTIGGASTDQLGILKSEDAAGGMTPTEATMLQNNTTAMGFAISGAGGRDGYIAGTVPTLNFVGIAEPIASLDNTNAPGNNAFTTSNGSIAVLGGFSGPTGTNRVLLAQITTNGIFHYEINLQIGTPSAGVQNFVASSPVGAEISLGSLSGTLGATLAAEPGTPNGNISFSGVSSNSLTANFTSGQGAKRILVARSGGTVNASPADASTYDANVQFGLGSQIGSGNFVVYNGSGNTVALTGLTPGTTYGFAVFEYNDNGTSGAENYRTSSFANGTQSTLSSVSYTWNAAAGGSWTNPSNWTPARNTPDATDVLIFNSAISGNITNVPTQTVAAVSISGGANVNLVGAGSNTLTIAGNSSTNDLSIAAGSSLNSPSLPSVSVTLNAGATASINGSYSTAAGGNLKASAAGAIVFRSGSSFTTNAGFTGDPFGSSVNNGIVFQSGASYVHNAGNNPFQSSAPNSVVDFQTGSNQTFNTATGFDGDKRTYRNLTINANIAASNTGTLNIANLTLGSNGALALTNSNATTGVLTITGNITNNSTLANALVVTNGSATFNGGSTSTLSGSGTGAINFNTSTAAGVTIAAGTTLAFNKGFTLNNLTLNGVCKFNAAGQTLTINKTIAGTGNFSPFGTYDASLNFVAGADPYGVISFGNAGMNNLTMARTSIAHTQNNPLKVYGNISITNGTSFNANGNLIIGSTAGRTGCYVPSGAGNDITGNVTIERYIPGGGQSAYHYLSIPVTPTVATLSELWGDDFPVFGTYPYVYSTNTGAAQPSSFPTVWKFDPISDLASQTPGWESAVGVNPVFAPIAAGYAAKSNPGGAVTVDASGNLYNFSFISLPCSAAAGNGYNLVGNPYPSPILFSAMYSLPGQLSMDNSYHAWNASGGNYAVWNGTVGTNGATDTIYSSQAVFIKATVTGQLLMDNSIRRTSSRGSFFRTSTDAENHVNENTLKLSVIGSGLSDQIAIYTTANGSDKFLQGKDIEKMVSMPGSISPEMYVALDAKNLSIKEYLHFNTSKEIELGVVIRQSGVYTFSVDEFSNVSTAENSWFIDMETNTLMPLSQGNTISLYLEAGDYRKRFYLNKAAALSVAEMSARSLQMAMMDNTLHVINNGMAAFGTIEVFGMDGKRVAFMQQALNNGVNRFEMPALSTGIYTAKLLADKQTITGKYFIK
ncbi:MAG: T9SS type A sorting domain-containing protein [Bacteroidota bacterium]